MSFSQRHILLTGGAGYVGSHCCVELLQAGWHVTILDDFSNASRDVIQRIGEAAGTTPPYLIEGDIRDKSLLLDLFERIPFSAVMHFAARKSVAESIGDPAGYWDVNVVGTLRLLQAMAQAGCERLVFSSSATVYAPQASMQGALLRENAPLEPITPYGDTKLACERLIAAHETAHPSFTSSILRYFNPAGAHPSALIGEEAADLPNNLIPYIAQVASGHQRALKVFGDDYSTPDGTGIRDYVHVCDLARGHLAALEALERCRTGHIVNLGTGRGYSVLEMRAAYSQASGQEIPYEIRPRRRGDLASCLCDTTRARELLNFEAKYGAEEICASSWAWMQQKKAEHTE